MSEHKFKLGDLVNTKGVPNRTPYIVVDIDDEKGIRLANHGQMYGWHDPDDFEHVLDHKFKFSIGEKVNVNGRIARVKLIVADAYTPYQVCFDDGNYAFLGESDLESISNQQDNDDTTITKVHIPTDDEIKEMMAQCSTESEDAAKLNNLITEEDLNKPMPKSTTKTAQYFMPCTPDRELTTHEKPILLETGELYPGEFENFPRDDTLDGVLSSKAYVSIKIVKEILDYVEGLRHCGLGKKKGLDYLEKFIQAKVWEYTK